MTEIEVTRPPKEVSPQRVETFDQELAVLDIRHLLIVWLKWSPVLLVLAAVGVYLGIRDVQNTVGTYQARMTVLPDSGSSGISDDLSQAATALTGIKIGGSKQTNAFDRLRLVVGSVPFAKKLQGKYGLMQRVFAGSWDANSNTWIRPSSDDFERTQRWRKFLGLSGWISPDLESLAQYIRGRMIFQESSAAGFITVSFTHQDPKTAIEMLRLVYFEADEMLRDQDTQDTASRLTYINQRLTEARGIDTRSALIGLLSSEQRKAMLLSSDMPYAARVVEPPYVSSRPIEPNVRSALLLPAMVAVALGLLIITGGTLLRRDS